MLTRESRMSATRRGVHNNRSVTATLSDMAYAYKVPPDAKINLKDYHPADTAGPDKDQGHDPFLS